MNIKRLKLTINKPGVIRGKQAARKIHGQPKNPQAPHVNPRHRAYGKARLDIVNRVKSQTDWDELWKAPMNPFILKFPWGAAWKQCIEYYVTDFAAEIGFWIDIFGLPVTALGPDYAQFSSPGGEISFAVVSFQENHRSTPTNAFRLQFFIDELQKTYEELSRRSVQFEQAPQLNSGDGSLSIATFRTPHGIAVDLWSEDSLTSLKDNHEQPNDLANNQPVGDTIETNENYAQEYFQDEGADSQPAFSPSGKLSFSKITEPNWQDFLVIPSEDSGQEPDASTQTVFDSRIQSQIPYDGEISEQQWQEKMTIEENDNGSQSTWQEERGIRDKDGEMTDTEVDEDDLEYEPEDDWDKNKLEEDQTDDIIYETLDDE